MPIIVRPQEQATQAPRIPGQVQSAPIGKGLIDFASGFGEGTRSLELGYIFGVLPAQRQAAAHERALAEKLQTAATNASVAEGVLTYEGEVNDVVNEVRIGHAGNPGEFLKTLNEQIRETNERYVARFDEQHAATLGPVSTVLFREKIAERGISIMREAQKEAYQMIGTQFKGAMDSMGRGIIQQAPTLSHDQLDQNFGNFQIYLNSAVGAGQMTSEEASKAYQTTMTNSILARKFAYTQSDPDRAAWQIQEDLKYYADKLEPLQQKELNEAYQKDKVYADKLAMRQLNQRLELGIVSADEVKEFVQARELNPEQSTEVWNNWQSSKQRDITEVERAKKQRDDAHDVTSRQQRLTDIQDFQNGTLTFKRLDESRNAYGNHTELFQSLRKVLLEQDRAGGFGAPHRTKQMEFDILKDFEQWSPERIFRQGEKQGLNKDQIIDNLKVYQTQLAYREARPDIFTNPMFKSNRDALAGEYGSPLAALTAAETSKRVNAVLEFDRRVKAAVDRNETPDFGEIKKSILETEDYAPTGSFGSNRLPIRPMTREEFRNADPVARERSVLMTESLARQAEELFALLNSGTLKGKEYADVLQQYTDISTRLSQRRTVK